MSKNLKSFINSMKKSH